MQNFGGCTNKGTWLYSNKPWIRDIDKYACTSSGHPHSCRQTYYNAKDSKGEWKAYGGEDLKATQTYPDDFGVAVQKLLVAHRGDILRDTDQRRRDALAALEGGVPANNNDQWEDAGSLDVVEFFLN